MPIKNLMHRFQPAQLYIVLVLSICYFSVQLVFSHITHALTLLMASYHMLCNIFALTGCIITIKHSKLNGKSGSKDSSSTQISANSAGSTIGDDFQKPTVDFSCNIEEQSLAKRERREIKLRNTFGWTRIDILTMLIVCIILASLSFSLLVEALQTLVHIDHQDTMHLPIHVMILGFVGLILNGVTYLLIGGYTMHQGSFLHVTPDGDVVLNRAMSPSGDLALKADERQLSKTANNQIMKMEDLKSADLAVGQRYYQPRRQGSVEMFRDLSSTIFVIVCAIIVYKAQDQEHTAKFIDPVLSIFSCVLLVTLSYPYMKESCLILLQTIPGSIDMEIFERQLVTKFPEIISYHDLHIWQLSAHKYVSTVHIKFQNPKLYLKIIEDVRSFFREQGITIITIQPEFHCAKSTPSLECLVQCQAPECAQKVCCKDSRSDLREISVCPSGAETKSQHDKQNGHTHSNNHNHKNENGHSHTPKCKSANEKPLELKISSLLKLKNVLKRSQSTSQLGSSIGEKSCNTEGILQKTASEWQVPGTTAAEATIAVATTAVTTSATKIVTSASNLPPLTTVVPMERTTIVVK